MSLEQLKASITEIPEEELMAFMGTTRNARSKPVEKTKRVGGQRKSKKKAIKANETPDISPAVAAKMRDLLSALGGDLGKLTDVLGED